MATPTTTTAATTTTFVSCAAESDTAPAVFGFAALYRAWQACRRGKRGTRKAQRYETRLLDNLVDTAQALHTQAWRPSRPIRFVTLHPKPREILAAEFGDRVVHHLLVPWFERLFEPVFIHDSHANRKGHGTHAAVQRLQTFLRRKPGAHYLQLDIANFFNSIDRRMLKRRLIQAGQPWCEVAENGYLRGGTKRRQLRAVWPAMPVPGSSFQSKSTERRAPAGLAKTLEAQP